MANFRVTIFTSIILFIGNAYAEPIKFGPNSFTINQKQEISYSREFIDKSLLDSMSEEQLAHLLEHRLRFQEKLSFLFNQEPRANHLYASLSATHLCLSSFYTAIRNVFNGSKFSIDASTWDSAKSTLYSLVLNSSQFITIDEDSFATFQSSSKVQESLKKYTKLLEIMLRKKLKETGAPLHIAGQELAVLANIAPIMWSDFYELIIYQEKKINEESFEQFIFDEVSRFDKKNYILNIIKGLLEGELPADVDSFLSTLNLANLGVPSNRDGRKLKSIGVYLVPDNITSNKLLERYPDNDFWDQWGGPHVTFSGFAANTPKNRCIVSNFLKNLIKKRSFHSENYKSQTLLSTGQKVTPYIFGGYSGLHITKIFDAHFNNLKKLGWGRSKRSWHLTLEPIESNQVEETDLESDKDLLLRANWFVVFVGGYELSPELNHYVWGKSVPISLSP